MERAGQSRPSALIVEDDRGQSELGALLLAEFDLDVSQVQSAEDAIVHLCACSGSVTVLLADIHLPGEMDGVALAQRVSVLWPSISVIVTSGDAENRAQELPTNCVFIPKPWRALDIVSAAERAWRADHTLQAVRL